MKSVVMIIPVRAERKCPPRTARGCASGEEGRLYTRIADAPLFCFVLVVFMGWVSEFGE